jgi:exoribonuclease R
MKMEENMVKKAGGDPTYRTWSPYIKQCIQCETFSYAKPVKKGNPEGFMRATRQLYDSIHSENPVEGLESTRPLSSIIKAYKKVFESIPECKYTKLILSNSKDDRLSWSIENAPSRNQPEEDEFDYSDQYLCNLRLYTYRKAEAIPYDSSKRIVKIRGEKNRRGAFDGDRVKVGIFSDNPPDKCYGRVLRVEREESDVKFVCRVSSYNPLYFYPIDDKNPKLINLPGLTRVLLRKKKGETIFHESDLESKDVVVFNPKSFDVDSDEVPLPQISQVIPISVARKMLFLVAFVRWKEKYPCPLGIVIGAYSKGHTSFNAERLLRFAHSVEYNSSDKVVSEPSVVPRDRSLPFYERAFTIDPDEAQNLDDALSIVRVCTDENGHEVYELGVHIVNAAKHIQSGTDVDKFTRSKGTSVYGGDKGKIMHMLPDPGTRSKLSLMPGRVRDVISVTCEVTFDTCDTFAKPHFSECSIHPAQIRSAAQLTYSDAQRIMDGHSPSERIFNQDPSLKDSMSLLFDIATSLRQQRFSSDAAFAYDINKEEEALCWQSHLLVEELMIWANNEVAKCIHSSFPNFALLRRQPSPNEEEKDTTVDSDQSVMSCSLHLSHYLPVHNNLDAPDLDIVIPHDTLRKIHSALKKRDKTLLTHYLSTDRLYPQLAAVRSKFRAISLRAEYCCTHEMERDATAYRHDSMCLDQYTHFTSPMRRYIDIEVQRLLLGRQEENRAEGADEKHRKHTDLCIHLNVKKKNATEYERKVKNVELATKFVASSQVYTAFISRELKSSVELAFPDLELSSFPVKAKDLRVTSHFLPSAREEKSDEYVWKLCISSLKKDFAANVLQLANLSVVKLNSSRGANLKALCISDSESLLNSEYFAVSLPSSAVKVPFSSWLKALKFVKDPTDSRMGIVSDSLPQIPSLPPSRSVDLSGKKCPFFDCEVKSTLKESDSLKVWLTWTMREPVISPAIQLVEVSPLLRICVQHNSHPAECFSDFNLTQASKKDYDSIGEYVDLWKKVLLAEAAQKSVRECQPVIIQDVVLQWPDLVIPEECIEELYYVPSDPVKLILPVEFVEHCFEFFDIRVGHLICVRYGYNPKQSTVRAVYHFVVHQVTGLEDDNRLEKPKEVVVSMEPVGKWNCRVSKEMKKELESGPSCELQVIALSVSYR